MQLPFQKPVLVDDLSSHRRMLEVSVCPGGSGLCAGVSQPSPPWTLSSIDDAIQAFDSGWPLVLRDQLDVHQDPEHPLLQVGIGRGR